MHSILQCVGDLYYCCRMVRTDKDVGIWNGGWRVIVITGCTTIIKEWGRSTLPCLQPTQSGTT